MNAGALNRRIRIEEASTSQDGHGQPVKTWGVLDHVWAEIRPLTVNERFQAQQISPEATTKMRIHYRDDVTVKMRVLYDGDYYDIEGTKEIGYREGLELICSLWKPEGG